MDRYDYFLFDWDGCLARTLEAWVSAYKVAFLQHGLSPMDAEIGYYLGDWSIATHFGIEDSAAFNQVAVAIAKSNLGNVELYDGAKDMLVELSKTKKLALVSSGSRSIVTDGLNYNAIGDLFDIVITGDDVTNHKPHPEALEAALNALGGSKEKTIMVGDSNKDIGAATNFGIDSMLIYPDSHKLFYDLQQLRDLGPTYVINRFSDLIATLS